MKPTNQNIVLGAGYVYFAKRNPDGTLGGERYLGDTPGFSVNVTSESLPVFSSDGPIAEKLAEFATQVDRAATITARNIDAENLALFLIGDAGSVEQEAGSVTDEALGSVQPGLWYQLGATDDNPVGARGVSAVTVSNGSTTFEAGADYELDEELARIYIVPGGAIEDGTDLTVDYTKSAASYEQISTHNLGAAEGALRYVAHNTGGRNRDMYIPSVTLRPDGEMAMKSRDTVQEMAFAASIGTQPGLAQIYVNGRPA